MKFIEKEKMITQTEQFIEVSREEYDELLKAVYTVQGTHAKKIKEIWIGADFINGEGYHTVLQVRVHE